MAKAVVQLSHDISLANLFRHLAGNPQWVSDVGRPGMVQIATHPRWGALSGKFVQSAIARELNEMASAPHMALSLYDGAMMHWKKWKTVYNPATHGRNVLGNVMFADLAGVDPLNPLNWRYYAEMIHTLRGKGKVSLDELHREGVLSGDFTLNELREILTSEVTRDFLPENMGSKVFGFVTLRGFRRLAENAYRLEDEMFKVAAYLKAKQSGMTAKEAAAHVRTWFPSYDHIPKSATMATGKRVFPFASFFYESMRIAGTALAHPIEQPAQALKFAKWMSIPSLITLFSLARLGLDDDDQKDVLAEMRGKLGGWPVFSALMPFADSEGRPVQWDLTNVIPYANVLGLRLDRDDEKPLWQDIIRTVLTSNPLGDIGISLATNEDQFSGREILVPGMSKTESTSAIGGFLGKKLLPPLTPGVGTTWSTLTAPQRARGTLQKRDQGQAAARALLGVDMRNAEPAIWRAIEQFRVENGYGPQAEGWGETVVSRGRNRLYEALINEDIPSLARELAYLEARDVKFESEKDIREWLRARNPITGTGRIKVADREDFLETLAPMQRAAVDRALEEFDRIVENAPEFIAEAEAERR